MYVPSILVSESIEIISVESSEGMNTDIIEDEQIKTFLDL